MNVWHQSLICNRLVSKTEEANEVSNTIAAKVQDIIDGHYLKVLDLYPLFASLVRQLTEEFEVTTEEAALFELIHTTIRQSSLVTDGADAETTNFELLLLAVSALLRFVQLNCTGPLSEEQQLWKESTKASISSVAPSKTPSSSSLSTTIEGPEKAAGDEKFSFISATSVRQVDRKTRILLEKMVPLGGSSFFTDVEHPELLLIAIQTLKFAVDREAEADRKNVFTGFSWWLSRALRTQQLFLSEKSPAIYDAVISLNETTEKMILTSHDLILTDELPARFYLEQGIFHSEFLEYPLAQKCFGRAREATHLELELTGVKGKRTKHQSFFNAQLVLKTNSSSAESASSSSSSSSSAAPQELDCEEEDILKRVVYEEELPQEALRLIDQAIIIGLSLDIKQMSPFREHTSREELAAYLERVAVECKNWLIHSCFLLFRARDEIHRTRTVERGLMQMQSLVDQFEDKEPSASERALWYFSLPYPSRHLLQKELGSQYLKMGIAVSALQIFWPLQMWNEIIQCYIIIGEPKKAEKMVREQLAIHETPELWSVLGDLTEDVAHYQTAWDLSKGHFTRAKRSQAKNYLRRGLHQEAIDAFELALSINPLYPECWFSLGCSAMKVEDYAKAAYAFQKTIQLSEEDADSWSNLGACFTKLNKSNEAFNAFQEALKHSRESWKLWENFLTASLSIGDMGSALRAVEAILGLKDSVDIKVVKVLSSYLSDRDVDKSREVLRLREKFTEVLVKIGNKMANVPEIWGLSAVFYGHLDQHDKEIECLQKQVRQIHNAPGWETEPSKFESLVEALKQLVESLVQFSSDPKPLYSTKLQIRGISRKCEELLGNNPAFASLATLTNTLTLREQELKNIR